MAEWASPNRTEEPQRRRFWGFEVGSFLFPTMSAIVGAATVGSLLAAGFVLLLQPMPAGHPAVGTVPRARTEPASPVVRTGVEPPPAVAARARFAPAALRGMAAPPPEKSLPPAAQSAMAEGDARFVDGDARAARFFYEQAVDAGSAEGALRMGETFDPAFSTAGRLRLAPGDRVAAKFWYRRAAELGSAEAKQRLDYLKTEATEDRATTKTPPVETPPVETPSDRIRHRAVRRHHRTMQPPKLTFDGPSWQVSYPRSDGP